MLITALYVFSKKTRTSWKNKMLFNNSLLYVFFSAPGNEAQSGQSGQFNTAPESAATLTRAYVIPVLIFAIIALVWR